MPCNTTLMRSDEDCVKETVTGVRNKIDKIPQSSRRGETNQN